MRGGRVKTSTFDRGGNSGANLNPKRRKLPNARRQKDTIFTPKRRCKRVRRLSDKTKSKHVAVAISNAASVYVASKRVLTPRRSALTLKSQASRPPTASLGIARRRTQRSSSPRLKRILRVALSTRRAMFRPFATLDFAANIFSPRGKFSTPTPKRPRNVRPSRRRRRSITAPTTFVIKRKTDRARVRRRTARA